MRAHDQRIEDNLEGLLSLYLPKPPTQETTIVAVAKDEDKRISYRIHTGRPGDAQPALERVAKGESTLAREFDPIPETPIADAAAPYDTQPTQIMTAKNNSDGTLDIRRDTVVRQKPKAGEERGAVDFHKSKRKARDMINKSEGKRVPTIEEQRRRPTRRERAQAHMQLFLLKDIPGYADAIKMNLLSKSGLVHNRVVRDLNLLESGIGEAAFHMRNDELQPALDRHFGIHNLKPSDKTKQADGCTIAALLMMNAAMLHQRIANGAWLPGVSDLESVKNEVNVVARIRREWERIMRHDFRPVLEPAVNAIHAIEDTAKLAGLERALRHIAAEAQRIAETYADMGADHAGPLFNRVMGNQASDGAFFTKPVAASIAARLTLDALGATDWTNPATWRETKILDPACGSGTLLAAILADMKRRAQQQGASQATLNDLQRNRRARRYQRLGHQPRFPAAGGVPTHRRQRRHPIPPNGTPPHALRPAAPRPYTRIRRLPRTARTKGYRRPQRRTRHSRLPHCIASRMDARRRRHGIRRRRRPKRPHRHYEPAIHQPR